MTVFVTQRRGEDEELGILGVRCCAWAEGPRATLENIGWGSPLDKFIVKLAPHDRFSGGEILHMPDCHVEKIDHMRNVKKIFMFCCILCCFVSKS